ncbi:MAG: calcium-binding protein, partial [Roseovarius sp.]|nr:calcium-binding protein [Roseovarius sp.]
MVDILGDDTDELLEGTNDADTISGAGGNDTINGYGGSDVLNGGDGADRINPGDNTNFDFVSPGAGDDTIDLSDVQTGFVIIDYSDFSDTSALEWTIDGATNTGSVLNVPTGAIDTIIDVENPLFSGWVPGGGLSARGGSGDDIFNLAPDGEQWMTVRGNAGNDTFNVSGTGLVQLDYRDGGAVTADLTTGEIGHDTFSDTLNGNVWGLRGSSFDDRITGDDTGLRIRAQDGDDTVEAGDGDDRIEGGAGNDTLRGGEGSDELLGGDGDDLIDPGDAGGRSGFDFFNTGSGNDTVDFAETLTSFATTRYFQLDGSGSGIVADIDGVANTASVDKGAQGTDTYLDIVNPLDSGFTTGGFGIEGSTEDDVFNLTTDSEQWMQVAGRAGDDTINISGDGFVRIQYVNEGPIVADLVNGTVTHDGFTDTINGSPWEIRASDNDDSILGSDADESFITRLGNDTLDGGGGFDIIRFDRTIFDSGLQADLVAGTVQGVSGSTPYDVSLTGIEAVRGTDFGDMLAGDAAANNLEGEAGDDTLSGGAGDDTVDGGAGSDSAVIAAARADAVVTETGDGLRIETPDGADLFIDVEMFDFADGPVSADELLDADDPVGETLIGTDGDDSLTGTPLDDAIAGGAGNDTLS